MGFASGREAVALMGRFDFSAAADEAKISLALFQLQSAQTIVTTSTRGLRGSGRRDRYLQGEFTGQILSTTFSSSASLTN
jgi:hypothetical protein